MSTLNLSNLVPGNAQAQEANALYQIAGEAQNSALDQRNYLQAALGQSQGYYAPAANMYNAWFGGASVPTQYVTQPGGAPAGYTPSYSPFSTNLGGGGGTSLGSFGNDFLGLFTGGGGPVSSTVGGGTGSPTQVGSTTTGTGASSMDPLAGVLSQAGTTTGSPISSTTPTGTGAASPTGTAAGVLSQAGSPAAMDRTSPAQVLSQAGTTGSPVSSATPGGTGTSTAAGPAAGVLSQAGTTPGAGAQTLSTAGGTSNPSQVASVGPQNGPLMSPGAGENAFSQYGTSVLNPSQNANYYSAAMGSMGGSFGNYQNQTQGYQGALGQPSASQNYYNNALGAISQPTQAQQTYGQTQGQLSGPNALQSAYGGLMSQYQKPGQLESFAASDMAGNNPYFQNLMSQGDKQIAQQQNSAGNYNSGATLAAQAMFNQNLLGQQYQQEGQLQGAAQQAGQQRIGAQGELAGALSGQNLSYLNSNNQAAQGVSSANLAQMMGGGNLANQATQSAYQDTMGAAGLGNTAYSQYLSGLGLGGQLANNATTSGLAQYNDYMNAANTAQSDQQGRAALGLGSSMALGQNQANLASTMYGQSNDAYAQMIAAALGAQVNAANTQAQGNQAQQNAAYSLLGSVL